MWLWGAQLVPALCLALFGLWRLLRGDGLPANSTLSVASLALGTAWAAVVAGMLITRAGRSWLVRRRVEHCLAAGVSVFCLVAIDVAMSVLGLVPTVETQRAHSVSYALGDYTRRRLVPQEVLVDGGPSIRINRRGFRGPEIPNAPEAGRTRIAFLGGSQVFDFAGGGWPGRVGEMLNARGHRVEVINAAVPGHNTADAAGKLLTDIWTLQPDIIFLCNAWNDFKYFRRIGPGLPYRELPPMQPEAWRPDWRTHPYGLDRYLSVLSIYRQFRWGIGRLLYNEEGLRRSPAAPTDNAGSRAWGLRQYALNIRTVAEIARHTGAQLVLCRQAHLGTATGSGPGEERARAYQRRLLNMSHDEVMDAFRETARIVDRIARERDIPVVDMDGTLSGRDDYFIDAIHYSETGSVAAAALVAAELERLLPRR